MIQRPNQLDEPMTQWWVLKYWEEFERQTDMNPEARTEYEFANFLKERSEYT